METTYFGHCVKVLILNIFVLPKVFIWTETPLSKVPPSPPQLCRKVSNLGGVLSRIIREAALHSAQLQAARSPLRRDCGRCGDLTFKTVGI